MTKVQNILIVVATAIVFQLATASAGLTATDFNDWRHWLVGVAVGIINAAGVAVLALYTSGGLSLPKGD